MPISRPRLSFARSWNAARQPLGRSGRVRAPGARQEDLDVERSAPLACAPTGDRPRGDARRGRRPEQPAEPLGPRPRERARREGPHRRVAEERRDARQRLGRERGERALELALREVDRGPQRSEPTPLEADGLGPEDAHLLALAPDAAPECA